MPLKELQRNFSNKEEDLKYAYNKYRNLLNGNTFANKLWDAGNAPWKKW